MNRLVAQQRCESSDKIIIQRTYLSKGEYKTISEVWVPKIPWFRPPAIRLFKWAYKVCIDVTNKVRGTTTTYNPQADGSGITQVAVQFLKGDKDEC